MIGVRIYELANELGTPSKKLIELATQMGYPVKSHSSTIDFGLADRIRKQAQVKGLATEKKPKKKKAEKSAPEESKTATPKKITTQKKPADLAREAAERRSGHVVTEPVEQSEEGAVVEPVVVEPVAPVEPTFEVAKEAAPVEMEEATPPMEVAKPEEPVVPEAKAAPEPAAFVEPKVTAPVEPKVSAQETPVPAAKVAPKPAAPVATPEPVAPAPPRKKTIAEQMAEKRRADEEARREARKKREQAEAIARKLREDDVTHRAEERDRKARELIERKKKEDDDKKRRFEEKKRHEVEAKLLAEQKKTEKEAAERRRREKEEERELQRLLEEEERSRQEVESRRIVIDEATTVKEFAEKLSIGVNEIIKKLIMKGIMANLNQTLDVEVARELAVDMGYELKTREEEEIADEVIDEEDQTKLSHRPPVVTIMGHVDHGKTSLLDAIRTTRVTDTEAGGITQRIGAYKVDLPKGSVVFLDTPGHEAFTAMRSRGAAVTDLVILVVAADDGVMPQTIEAIHHASAAGVPVIVAVNKIDKPGGNPEKVKQELTGHNLVPEEWGGETIFCDVSAKQKLGIENLLDMILLQAEVLELTANPDREAFGTIIESKLDKGRGAVATVLVQKGTLKIGDPFVAGVNAGKVRALISDTGARITEAGPSTPVEVLGFAGVPNAGDTFMVVENDRKANQIAISRQNQERMDGLTALSKGHVRLESLHAQITKGEVRDLNIIVKADLQGSIEAVSKAFEDIPSAEVRIRVLHGAVGAITESDVSLADASNAIIIGFNVRPTEKARQQAEAQEVDMRLYSVIYNAIDDIKLALEGMLAPVFKEETRGRAEVREVFNITKIGAIAGSMVTSGKLTRNSKARLLRDNVVIYDGKIESLRRFKDDVREVASGYECGIGLENYSDIKNSDIVEAYDIVEVEKKLV